MIRPILYVFFYVSYAFAELDSNFYIKVFSEILPTGIFYLE